VAATSSAIFKPLYPHFHIDFVLFALNGRLRGGRLSHTDFGVINAKFVSKARGRHILRQLHATVLLYTQFRIDFVLFALNGRLRGGRLTYTDFGVISACAIGASHQHASIHHPSITRKAHSMGLHHTAGDAIVHVLLPHRAAKDQ
jgi:hypothetical protein